MTKIKYYNYFGWLWYPLDKIICPPLNTSLSGSLFKCLYYHFDVIWISFATSISLSFRGFVDPYIYLIQCDAPQFSNGRRNVLFKYCMHARACKSREKWMWRVYYYHNVWHKQSQNNNKIKDVCLDFGVLYQIIKIEKYTRLKKQSCKYWSKSWNLVDSASEFERSWIMTA